MYSNPTLIFTLFLLKIQMKRALEFDNCVLHKTIKTRYQFLALYVNNILIFYDWVSYNLMFKCIYYNKNVY